MATIRDGNKAVLLVVDVQNGVMSDAWEAPRVVRNVARAVERAREQDVPVIWIQHASEELVEGTEVWQYVPELQRAESEPLIHKRFGDSFEDTTLESELAQRGVGRLVVTGAQTDACVRATIHGAFARGYDTVLVGDAHTTEDLTEYGAPAPDKVIAHTNMYWSWQDGPGRTASVVDTASVDFSAS